MLNIIAETGKKFFAKPSFVGNTVFTWISATKIILTFLTTQVRRLLLGATYLAFIWKFDVTKKGIDYGITIFHSRLPEFYNVFWFWLYQGKLWDGIY